MIEFKNGAYYCETKEIMENLLKEFEKANIKWYTGQLATENNIDEQYQNRRNCIYYDYQPLSVCSLEYAAIKNIRTINAKTLLIRNYETNELTNIIKKYVSNSTLSHKDVFKVMDEVCHYYINEKGETDYD